MICSVDSSAFVNAIEGLRDERMTLLRKSLRANEVRLAPVVVTELLSKPHGYNARRFITTIRDWSSRIRIGSAPASCEPT